MKSEMPLDYGELQLSPKRSRCELFVYGDGTIEKLASGSVKPFVTHLKVAEEQVALAVRSIKLDVEKCKNAGTWFTKGTLERFVRFVSTPEILELVNTFDAEMSQLEAAQRIYSQGAGGQHSGILGRDGTGTAAADATKKELLRAIDVRLVAVSQDLTTAYFRASAAGFNPNTVSELQLFANWFGAHRLNEACTKFISLCHRRPELINQWKPSVDDGAVRSSFGSDMSIDDPIQHPCGPTSRPQRQPLERLEQLEDVSKIQRSSTCQQPNPLSMSFPKPNEKNKAKEEDTYKSSGKEETHNESSSLTPSSQPSSRLSVLDRINLFENKQKNSGGGSGGKPIVAKSVALRRLSSDISSAPAIEKAVLRRWSGVSDMSIDVSGEKKDTESPLCTPSSVSQTKSSSKVFGFSEEKDQNGLNDYGSSLKVSVRSDSDCVVDGGLKDQCEGPTWGATPGKEEELGSKARCNWKDQASFPTQAKSFGAPGAGQDGLSNHGAFKEKLKISSISEERSSWFNDEVGSAVQSSCFLDKVETSGETTHSCQQAQVRGFTSEGEDISTDAGLWHKVEDSGQVRASNSFGNSHSRSFQSRSRPLSGQFEGGSGLKFKESSRSQQKGVKCDHQLPQPQRKSFTGGFQHTEVDLPPSLTPLKMEDSGVQKMKFQKQVSSGNDHIKKPQVTCDENNYVYENSKINNFKEAALKQENVVTMSTPPVEPVQRVRQTRGKQELHDELNMKANELDKLFAEQKLRIPGDQSSLARRNKHANMHVELAVSSNHRMSAAEVTGVQFPETSPVIKSTSDSSNMALFNTTPMMKVVDNHGYDTPKQNTSEFAFSHDSRGKLYGMYMKKRDAKLREEWISKKSEKEAKLKAMQDSFERSKAELKAKLSGSAKRQDSTTSAHQRAEKLRSFNLQSSMKWEQVCQFPVKLSRNQGKTDNW